MTTTSKTRIGSIANTIPGLTKEKVQYQNSEDELDLIWNYIEKMDFSLLKNKICKEDNLFPYAWNEDDAEDGINQYKMYLFICRKYISEYVVIPPSQEIDEIWHHHILDTRSYIDMCNFVFGGYFHHYPYFGVRGNIDKENLNYSFKVTIDLFQKEFGSKIYMLRDYNDFLSKITEA